MKSVKAEVCWISEEDGGRSIPAFGATYSTVARFEDEKDRYPTEAWSLVLKLLGPSNQKHCTIAEVRFLVDDGPDRLLRRGSRFELYEGHHLVAKGTTL